MIDMDYLNRVEEFLKGGDLEFEFENCEEDRKYALLDFLEKLIELGELSDEMATKLIFKGKLDLLASGGKSQED